MWVGNRGMDIGPTIGIRELVCKVNKFIVFEIFLLEELQRCIVQSW